MSCADDHRIRVLQGRHTSPHEYLGLHECEGKKRVRLFRPGFEKVSIEIRGAISEMFPIGDGFYEIEVPSDLTSLEYRVMHKGGILAHDPYAFPEILTGEQIDRFHKGEFYDAYAFMGGRLKTLYGTMGATFCVWAPNAVGVSVTGDFNHFDKQINPMRKKGDIWQLFIPGLKHGEKYKFFVQFQDGGIREKADPYELYSEMRPKTASILYDPFDYHFEETEWKKNRNRDTNCPISIYEFHMGSWKKGGSEFPSYKQVAHELAEYCKDLHYTHVEVLPISAHPLDESWGYQVTGYFGVTSRYGEPSDFQYFVNHMHKNGIGVILDWVPAHFPQDDYSFALFDGTPLYEHADPLRGFHPMWTTSIFDYAKPGVITFLLSSALYYLEVMHVDGIRVDAVSSMLFLDYERKPGEWKPNEFGGNQNLEAIAFIKKLNQAVHARNPHALMIAEESHAFPKVTAPIQEGGLGFDLKWNLGWMNDTLRFFSHDYQFRHHELKHLYFTQVYMHEEKYLLVLSHDEVVHEKKSLLEKMPGNEWEQFASLRTLYAYKMCFPGKKLLFMGGEIGQRNEWDCKGELQWELLNEPLHLQLNHYVKALQEFYLQNPALWKTDYAQDTFIPIRTSYDENCVLAFVRQAEGKRLLTIHNFQPRVQTDCLVYYIGNITPAFCSALREFGGSEDAMPTVRQSEMGQTITLPPLSSVICTIL